jgi:hypothetical protein
MILKILLLLVGLAVVLTVSLLLRSRMKARIKVYSVSIAGSHASIEPTDQPPIRAPRSRASKPLQVVPDGPLRELTDIGEATTPKQL